MLEEWRSKWLVVVRGPGRDQSVEEEECGEGRHRSRNDVLGVCDPAVWKRDGGDMDRKDYTTYTKRIIRSRNSL